MRIAVVTDSTSGLSGSTAHDRPHAVVPLTVAVGDTVYTDGVDITTDAFYTLMAHRQLATTSQPPPALFSETYAGLAADGFEAVVSVHCAAQLSGTFSAAQEAARHAPIPVTVVDTKTIGAALSVVVRAAVRTAANTLNVDEVASAARDVAAASRTFFIVDDLDHLRRGGRLKATQAAIGQALHVKPLLHIADDGTVAVAQRHRTWKRAVSELAAHASTVFATPVYAVIAHATAPERATHVEQELRRVMDVQHVEHDVIGPVVGAHVGAGAAGVALVPVSLLP